MELKKWPSNNEVEKFFETLMDEPFKRFFKKHYENFESFTKSGILKPSMDMVDKDDHLMIRAELPGVESENINISLLDDVLTIKGESTKEVDEEKDDYRYSEIAKGKYERSIKLPNKVNESKISAKFKNGILEIKLPKGEVKKPKKIQIKKDE